MSSPRHLWSGDWQLDSAAVAEELAKQRARSGEPEEPAPDRPPPPRKPSATERLLAALRDLRRFLARVLAQTGAVIRNAIGRLSGRGRRLGVALVVVVVTLLSAGVAFGVTSLLIDSGGSSKTASAGHVWLGIVTVNAPYGVGAMVTTVAPGSPAASAGLQSGDVTTQINNQAIQGPSDVNAALAGLRAGNELQVQFNRGPTSYSTLVTLAARPASP
jgi:membrane-associated protease RseP (regulator of RpoE activity)